MKINLYRDLQKENRVEVQVEQEAIITNQVIHFNHVNINDKKVPCDGNAIFTFEEEFRIKGLNTPDGRLNVKVNFIYKIPGKAHIYIIKSITRVLIIEKFTV